VVGANASGKTNIIRMFEVLSRFKDAPSSLWIEVLLSQNEIKMLLQLLFKSALDKNAIDDKLRKMTLMIYWPTTPNETEEPELVFARFENGFAIWKSGDDHYIGYIASLPSDGEELHELVSNTKNIHGETENIFYNSHKFTFDKLLQQSEFKSLLLKHGNVSEFFVIAGINIAIPYNYAGASYNPNKPEIYVVELLDFCGLTRTSEHNITFWHLLRYFLAHSIVILREIRPPLSTTR